jgi:hypothetical protein
MLSSIRAFWFQTHQSNQCWPHHIRIGAAVALVVAGWTSRGWAQEAKDILWYGNSFTNAVCCGSTRSVPSVVADGPEPAILLLGVLLVSPKRALTARSYGIRCTPLLPSSAELALYSDAVLGRRA